MSFRILVTALVASLLSVPALAQQAVVLVRHAERADSGEGTAPKMATDPELSHAGRARAESLAAMLKDAGITAIFVTEYRRTQQSAAPLAKALRITPTIVKASDTAGLREAIKAHKGNVLVVGHSNTVPDVIKALGITVPVTIGDDEYDRLFIVTAGPPPSLLGLHYR